MMDQYSDKPNAKPKRKKRVKETYDRDEVQAIIADATKPLLNQINHLEKDYRKLKSEMQTLRTLVATMRRG